jgi:hypothetical protein
MLRHISNSRDFAFFDLVCASVSGLIWFFLPEFKWWPLLLAVLPWFLRLLVGYFPFKRTLFDLPILFFLLTAGLGVWASYDTTNAWEKYWVVVGAIFIYYALAGQPKSNLTYILAVMTGLGVVIASSMFLDTKLSEYTPDLPIIQRFLTGWEATRPELHVTALPPNISGGIIAILLPFSLLLSVEILSKNRAKWNILALLPVFLMVGALFLSSSRGAWGGIAAAVVVLLLIYGSRYTKRYLHPYFRVFLTLVFIAAVFVGVRYIVVDSERLANTFEQAPVSPFGNSRLDLITNSWDLVVDYLFTGGGLRAFPGLYSRYILLIPVLFFEYSHNLYLDIALEQGLVGVLSFIWIISGSLLIGIKRLLKKQDFSQFDYLQLTIVAGLVIVILHGLIDNPLYGMKGTPLLFLLPGLNIALIDTEFPSKTEQRAPSSLFQNKTVWGSILFGLMLLFISQPVINSVKATWYANLGSIYMSKVELSDFPANRFDILSEYEYSGLIEGFFAQTLAHDPSNTTANYRSGLLASQKGDFTAAVAYLRRAYEENSRHRGIRKALGYNYAWAGHPEHAAGLLSEIPEAGYELEVYIWWWETQSRPDLALKSQIALEHLSED